MIGIRQECANLVEDYPAAWSRQATDDLDGLAGDVLDLLAALGLAERNEENGWLLSPAAARWVPVPDDRPAREQPPPEPEPEPRWSLFDADDDAEEGA